MQISFMATRHVTIEAFYGSTDELAFNESCDHKADNLPRLMTTTYLSTV